MNPFELHELTCAPFLIKNSTKLSFPFWQAISKELDPFSSNKLTIAPFSTTSRTVLLSCPFSVAPGIGLYPLELHKLTS